MKRCTKCKQEFANQNEPCSFDGKNHNSDALIGVLIDDKYRLEHLLGRGGMGAVYAAQHTKFNKKVAIKILPQNLTEVNPGLFERFQREAEASARIKHPNAVAVTDFGQTRDGITYLVMEYIDGVALRRLLDREKQLSPERLVALACQICSGISAAHHAGVIHRDLKPDNVMIETIDNREVARVVDFGIAKLKDAQQTNLTETGSLLGTPTYMALEQCTGGNIDARTDIYSLGVMLYEMLAGQPPFRALTAPAVIVMHVTQTPKPISEINPDVPERLARVIMRTLEKSQELRPQSANELSEQLEAAISLQAKQWRVIFYGLLDDSEENRQRLIKGLEQVFNITSTKAESLIRAQPISVKKTVTVEEANRVAEKLRNIGANVKVEPIIAELSNATLAMPGTKIPDKEAAVVDPLLVTDGFEMLSYASQQAKLNSGPLKVETGQLGEAAQTSSDNDHVGTEQITLIKENVSTASANVTAKPVVATGQLINWSVDIDGQIYENVAESEMESWLRNYQVLATNKARRGEGNWCEIGAVPKFRRILQEIEAQNIKERASHPEAKQNHEPPSENQLLLRRIAKIGAIVFVLYVGVGLGWLYFKQRLIQDDLRAIFIDNKTNIMTLRKQIHAALDDRNVDVPDDNITISADFPNQSVSVQIDYKQSMLLIPIRYRAKRDNTHLKMPMDHMVGLMVDTKTKVELVGITPEKIADYRRQKEEEEARKRDTDQIVPDRPLNQRDALIMALRGCENGDCPKTNLIVEAAK